MQNISWQTVEHRYSEKKSDWYWVVGIVTISIVLIAIILNNTIFAVLILVSSFALSLLASRKPQVVGVVLGDRGITFGDMNYPYSKLKSFWVETRDYEPRLLLQTDKVFMPFVIIFIEKTDPENIRDFLSQHLPEEEHREPLLEKVLIYFGF